MRVLANESDDEQEDGLGEAEVPQAYALGTITRFLTVCVDGAPRPWLELRLGLLQPRPPGTSALPYLHFKLTQQRYYIPYGVWCGWSVARRVLLMADPLHKGGLILNHRLKYQIQDRWPTASDFGASTTEAANDADGERRGHELEDECFSDLLPESHAK